MSEHWNRRMQSTAIRPNAHSIWVEIGEMHYVDYWPNSSLSPSEMGILEKS